MDKSAKKPWTLRRKVVVSVVSVIVMGCIIFSREIFGYVKVVGMIMAVDRLTKPDTAATPAELRVETRAYVNKYLSGTTRIPDSATEIYVNIQAGGPDSWFYCSVTLPDKDFIKFAEQFAGVPITEFKGGRPWSMWSDSPPRLKKGWKPYYWNIKGVKNGKHYSGRRGSICIDLDINRLYICVDVST